MTGFWFSLLERLTRFFGPWLFAIVSRIIAAGYFVFSKNSRESIRFYARLYPEKNILQHLFCTFRQYQNFTTIHYDRFLADHCRKTTFVSEGWEKLQSVVQNSGAILLMSHLGNWEIAAKLLQEQEGDSDLLLYMGVKEKEGVEGVQKDQLKESGISIVGAPRNGGSPFDAVTGIRLLQKGGIVSMTGDILWRDDQRSIEVDFLGAKVHVPEAPYVFALVSGAPIFCFSSQRVGTNSYHFRFADPIYICCEDRSERRKTIEAAAQQYADLLAAQVRRQPLEWYHFGPFV